MNMYLIPILLVCIIGIIAGVLLTVAAKLMYVPVDERITDCTEALPGANCGGCGFAGCSDYATAIVEGGAELNRCPVGGAEVAAKLGVVMGVAVEAGEGSYAAVKCGGYGDKAQKLIEYKGISTCKAVKSMYNGDNVCAYGCLGMGDCAAACNFNAIGVVNGVAWVDRENCVGCGACAKVCPNHIIDMVPKKSIVYVACSSCDKGADTRRLVRQAVSAVKSAKRLVSLKRSRLWITMQSLILHFVRTVDCARRNVRRVRF